MKKTNATATETKFEATLNLYDIAIEDCVTKTEFRKQVFADKDFWNSVDLEDGETKANYFEMLFDRMAESYEVTKIGNRWYCIPWEFANTEAEAEAPAHIAEAEAEALATMATETAEAAPVAAPVNDALAMMMEQLKAQQTLIEQLTSTIATMNATPAPVADTPAPVADTPAPVDYDELKARRDKSNNAILATIPKANRGVVSAMLARVHKAGYPYARLQVNKKHQLDGLHIYAGEKGRGRDDAFKACATKAAAAWREKADTAKANENPAPKRPERVFIYSPVGGGNFYARGIFAPTGKGKKS